MRAANLRVANRWASRARRRMRGWRLYIATTETLKRALDVLVSVTALVVFLPFIALAALLIKWEDGGRVLFAQKRIGQGGRIFTMYKFRTMVEGAEDRQEALRGQNRHGAGSPTFKMEGDPRVTRQGRWMRRFSIDEIPQFFNVLRGDMSVVGPRPPVPSEVSLYRAIHLRRLRVKPGLTCLWQIGGRSEVDFEGQVRLDLAFIHSESLWGDFLIVLKTVPAVLLGRGAY